MQSRSDSPRTVLSFLSVAVAFCLVFSNASAVVGYSQSSSNAIPNSPIKHIVIIIQENHSFDNYFGTYPGLLPGYGLNMSECDPNNMTDPSSICVYPFNADSESAQVQGNDLQHNWNSSHDAYNNGSMDGFVYAQLEDGKKSPQDAMAYYTSTTIPNLWDYASYYSLDANFFSSELSYSYPNHLYLVAAQSGGCEQCRPTFDLNFSNIGEELSAPGVNINWKFYGGDWDDSNDCKTVKSSDWTSLAEEFWNVLPDFPAIDDNPSTCHRIQNLNDLYKDLSKGNLPNVAFVTPDQSNSDHPGFSSMQKSQLYLTNIINGISENKALWNSTVIFLTWDEFGGYSDQLAPPQVDGFGYGFRVPLLVISPYTMEGKIYYGVSGEPEDFSSFLSTIESWAHLSNLSARDGVDASLFYMLNFSQTPRPPLILPSNILATYPVSSCKKCRIGFGQPAAVPDPPAYNIPAWYNLADVNNDDAS